MRFFQEKQETSPNGSDYPTITDYGDDVPGTIGYGDDLPVQCPPHTTERKLLARIDLHVMPFLCIMYRTCHPHLRYRSYAKVRCSTRVS